MEEGKDATGADDSKSNSKKDDEHPSDNHIPNLNHHEIDPEKVLSRNKNEKRLESVTSNFKSERHASPTRSGTMKSK